MAVLALKDYTYVQRCPKCRTYLAFNYDDVDIKREDSSVTWFTTYVKCPLCDVQVKVYLPNMTDDSDPHCDESWAPLPTKEELKKRNEETKEERQTRIYTEAALKEEGIIENGNEK